MGVISNIKDTTRKVANSVVDTTQETLNIPKSPKELAKRMIEHLSRQEYHEVATMLSAEVKKYVDKMGLEDSEMAKAKLADFEKAADSMATNFENNDYRQVAIGLEKLEKSIPDELSNSFGILKTAKNVLSNITATLKKHIENGTTPEFGNLTEMIESLYTQHITK